MGPAVSFEAAGLGLRGVGLVILCASQGRPNLIDVSVDEHGVDRATIPVASLRAVERAEPVPAVGAQGIVVEDPLTSRSSPAISSRN